MKSRVTLRASTSHCRRSMRLVRVPGILWVFGIVFHHDSSEWLLVWRLANSANIVVCCLARRPLASTVELIEKEIPCELLDF